MKLYKKDSSGKIRYLDIIASGDSIVQRSGVLDTENEVEHIKKAKPKNIGKTNETTAEQQAILEVGSIIKSKLQEGYFKTEQEAMDSVVILPMLAKKFEDEEHKIDLSNCYSQKKLDGQRCLAIKKDGKVKLISSDGVEIKTLNHIVTQLEDYSIPDNIYDGEIYNLDLGEFQDQMKAIKKYRPGITDKLNYNIYYIISKDKFSIRNKIICSIFEK